jgi:hypothetical protein
VDDVRLTIPIRLAAGDEVAERAAIVRRLVTHAASMA